MERLEKWEYAALHEVWNAAQTGDLSQLKTPVAH